jgi:multiple antibiotic resistance protein
MYHAFITAFIPLFVCVDAPEFAPIFLALTAGMTTKQRRVVTFETVFFALAITLAFAFIGKAVFRCVGISEADFKVAGGTILLVLTVIDCLKTTDSPPTERKNFGLFPLAVPLVAGPATLTTALVLAGREDCGYAFTAAGIISNFFILLIVLLAAVKICELTGIALLQAFSKIVMVLLAAIAVNLIHTGIAQMWREMNVH